MEIMKGAIRFKVTGPICLRENYPVSIQKRDVSARPRKTKILTAEIHWVSRGTFQCALKSESEAGIEENNHLRIYTIYECIESHSYCVPPIYRFELYLMKERVGERTIGCSSIL